jgi:hypothetical protein
LNSRHHYRVQFFDHNVCPHAVSKALLADLHLEMLNVPARLVWCGQFHRHLGLLAWEHLTTSGHD